MNTITAAQNEPRNWRQRLKDPYVWALACSLIALSILAAGHYGLPGIARMAGGSDESGLSRQMAELDSSLRPVSKSQGASTDLPAPPETSSADAAPETTGPMIAQTASLTIVAANYDQASLAIDHLAVSKGGYVQKLTAEAPTGASRDLSATLRVPAKQLDGALAELRKLGHVEEESRTNDEVTDQYVDLQARLKTSRASEQRLLELLGTRTGKLEDVLDAERELARVREEIESMEGQRILLEHRVDYATIEVQLREEYREKLHSESSGMKTKFWNATVEGLANLEESATAILLFILAYGLSILFWAAIVLVPVWFVLRRFRSRRAPLAS